MAHFDLPIPELRTFRAPDIPPPDFDEYWSTALAEVAEHPLNARFTPVHSGYVAVRNFDVSFVGAEGARGRVAASAGLHGWPLSGRCRVPRLHR